MSIENELSSLEAKSIEIEHLKEERELFKEKIQRILQDQDDEHRILVTQREDTASTFLANVSLILSVYILERG